MSLPSNIRHLGRDSSGTTIVEAAIVLPALFAMCLGVIETSRAMWMQNSLQDAVDAAARCGAVSASCADAAKIKAYAATQVQGFSVAASQFTSTVESCGIKVSASVPFNSSVILLGSLNINLTAESCRPYSP